MGMLVGPGKDTAHVHPLDVCVICTLTRSPAAITLGATTSVMRLTVAVSAGGLQSPIENN